MKCDSVVADETSGRRSVLGRAFEILDCFAVDGEQTIASLCEQTGLPPATVHRMLASLVEWGAVERASRGRYLLGRRLWRLGVGVPQVRRLREVARPTLVDLHTATRSPVLIGALEDDDAILITDVIAGRESHHLFRHQSRITGRGLAPWVVVAAFGATEATSSARSRSAMVNLNYRQSVSLAKRVGFALTTSEGYAWISAPVFDAEGALRSILSVVVPEDHVREAVHGPLVVRAAQEISAGLGHRRSMALIDASRAVEVPTAV